MLRRACLFYCCCLLAACSSLPAATYPSDDSGLVLDAIAHAQRVVSASPEDQRRELAIAAQAFIRERDAGSRLRYGVLLALPALAGADPQRAAATLEPLSAEGNSASVRQFAALMLGQISERQKEQRRALQFKEQLDEQSSERQKERRRALQLKEQLKEQLDEQSSERQTEQRRGQQLKEQLDELRAVERALIERGQPKK